MEFFNRIIRMEETALLFGTNSQRQELPIGDLVEIDTALLKGFMNIWCQRLDKIVNLDIEVNGRKTHITDMALLWRGFTYEEYWALFNAHIKAEEYPFYPIFNQLNKHKGGINTEKQRLDFTLNYQLNEEDYHRILKEQGFIKVINFFIDLVKPSATIPLDKLLNHLYCVAPTGEGKSVLMEALIHKVQTQYPQFGIVVIDPHGSLAEGVKRFKINYNSDRVIYIDPYLKNGFTPTFNPFHLSDASEKNLNFTAEQIIKAMEETLVKEGGEFTENMVNLMEKSIYFLLNRKGSSLNDLLDLLDCNETLFKEAQFFDSIFDNYFMKAGNKIREGLLNRTSRILNAPVMRNLVGGESTFDLEQAMNNGKIVIFNLSELGEMSQIAFGRFIVASIKSIVRKRKKNGSIHTFCFIDEAQNFVTGSMEYILSQLRGFGLHLVLANQYIEQFGTQAKAVIRNTAVKIVGGGDDNMDSIKELINLSDNATLNNYEFFLKVRHESVVKFKSPNFLLKNRSTYYMTQEEEKTFDEFQIRHYYKSIKDDKMKPIEQAHKQVEVSKVTDESKPPFDLFIDEA